MNIAIPTDEELELPTQSAGYVGDGDRIFDVVAADDGDDFDENDFDDEFDDDFEEELEDEYELSEFEDVTEDDLVEGDDDLDTIGGDFVDEDAEPEESPAEKDDEAAGEKDAKGGKGKDKDAKPGKAGKKKGKAADEDEDDEDFDDED
jgi:hypothetical protein